MGRLMTQPEKDKWASLTPKHKEAIAEQLRQGHTAVEIAEEYGVNSNYIRSMTAYRELNGIGQRSKTTRVRTRRTVAPDVITVETLQEKADAVAAEMSGMRDRYLGLKAELIKIAEQAAGAAEEFSSFALKVNATMPQGIFEEPTVEATIA